MTSRGLLVSLGLGLGLGLGLIPATGCGHRSSPADVPAQAEARAIAVGARAPEAQLIGTTGAKVALADQIHQHARTVVVFYRGFW